MNSLDKILIPSIINTLEEYLGNKTYKKIEKDVFQTYGLLMIEAVEDFSRIDLVLRKFFGNRAIKIELKIFKKIISIKKDPIESSIMINDQDISKRILESYSDPVKKIILELLLKQPKSIPKIINEIKLPHASTYRRIKELIHDGLLTMVGHTKASDGRKVKEYVTIFNRVIFDIQDKGVYVSVRIQNKFLKDSFVFNSIYQK